MPVGRLPIAQTWQAGNDLRTLWPAFLAMLDESGIFIHPARSRLQDVAVAGIAGRPAANC